VGPEVTCFAAMSATKVDRRLSLQPGGHGHVTCGREGVFAAHLSWALRSVLKDDILEVRSSSGKYQFGDTGVNQARDWPALNVSAGVHIRDAAFGTVMVYMRTT
jgi:hypothetical protein